MDSVVSLLPGARVAVRQCLAVRPTDRVFIITDDETEAIGEALARVAGEQGAPVELVTLESCGQRPFLDVPEPLVTALRAFAPTVTFFAAQGQPGEVSFRIKLGHLLRHEFQTRHGHMIGITPELMRTGMCADYERVAARTHQVHERVRRARSIRVLHPNGTDFTASFDPDGRTWVPCTGLYHEPGQWGNLPEGEVFTAPVSAEGMLVAILLGDYFSHKYGLLAQPVRFTVEAGTVVHVDHPDTGLAREVWTYLERAENGRRVGEFAIGTNEALTALTGNLLQDEKFPGVHVAFGNPYPDLTGADWTSTVHMDVIPGVGVTIWADEELIMDQGTFVLQ
ncbi:MAG: aminopeptidase [Ardenticatenia bacterium]|nr:aminopeptidase [Ardenticatenia bacterium]